MFQNKSLFCVATAGLLLHVGLTHEAIGQSIPTEMELALKNYRSLNPLSISWKSNSTYTAASENHITTNYLYERHSPRFFYRHELLPSEGKRFKLDYRFDGKVLAGLHGKQSASWYKIESLVKTQPRESRFRLNYFDAVGIDCPLQIEELPSGQIQSNITRLLGSGGELISIDEVQLDDGVAHRVEIESDNPRRAELIAQKPKLIDLEKNRPSNEQKTESEVASTVEQLIASLPARLRWVYWISPRHRYAVLRHERRTVRGALLDSFSNESFETVNGAEVVLARHVKAESFGRFTESGYQIDSSPFKTYELVVEHVSTESISPERFSLKKSDVAPGMRVIDAVTPGLQRDGRVITFVMPADPDHLERAVDDAKAVSTQR